MFTIQTEQLLSPNGVYPSDARLRGFAASREVPSARPTGVRRVHAKPRSRKSECIGKDRPFAEIAGDDPPRSCGGGAPLRDGGAVEQAYTASVPDRRSNTPQERRGRPPRERGEPKARCPQTPTCRRSMKQSGPDRRCRLPVWLPVKDVRSIYCGMPIHPRPVFRSRVRSRRPISCMPMLPSMIMFGKTRALPVKVTPGAMVAVTG